VTVRKEVAPPLAAAQLHVTFPIMPLLNLMARVMESREMLGIMPPQASPQPQRPCLGRSIYRCAGCKFSIAQMRLDAA
jgi:hypothetical protein